MYSSYELRNINKLSERGLYIYKVLEDKVSTFSNIVVKCENGHVTEGLVKNLTRLNGCPTCQKIKPFYELEDKLKKYGYTVLTKDIDYEGSESNISYICNKGHHQSTTVRSIRKGRKCYECYKYGTYDKVLETFKVEGYVMLTSREEYVDTKSNVNYKCNNGHIGKATVSDLSNGNRCAQCNHINLSERFRIPLEELLKVVNDSGYEIVSGCETYKNNNSRFAFKCPKGHIYETSAVNFRHLGSRCKKCSDQNNSGENNYAWGGGIKELNQYVRDKTYKWKSDSLLHGKYQCFITGLKNNNLVVHHPINLGTIVKESLMELNIELKPNLNDYEKDELNSLVELSLLKHDKYGLGVVMLDDLHRLFHKIYGNRNNNMNQLLEFKENYLNGNLNSYLENN